MAMALTQHEAKFWFDENANKTRFSPQTVSLEIGACHAVWRLGVVTHFACILVVMIMKCPKNVHGVDMQIMRKIHVDCKVKTQKSVLDFYVF